MRLSMSVHPILIRDHGSRGLKKTAPTFVYSTLPGRGASGERLPAVHHRRTATKRHWAWHEDMCLRALVLKHGLGRWTVVASSMPERTAKQCRERWINHLDPAVNRSEWSPEEDLELIRLHSQFGNAWVRIAELLPGRTDNSVKNRWHSSTIQNCLQREQASKLARCHLGSDLHMDAALESDSDGDATDTASSVGTSSPPSATKNGWSDTRMNDDYTLEDGVMQDFLDGIDLDVLQLAHDDVKAL